MRLPAIPILALVLMVTGCTSHPVSGPETSAAGDAAPADATPSAASSPTSDPVFVMTGSTPVTNASGYTMELAYRIGFAPFEKTVISDAPGRATAASKLGAAVLTYTNTTPGRKAPTYPLNLMALYKPGSKTCRLVAGAGYRVRTGAGVYCFKMLAQTVTDTTGSTPSLGPGAASTLRLRTPTSDGRTIALPGLPESGYAALVRKMGRPAVLMLLSQDGDTIRTADFPRGCRVTIEIGGSAAAASVWAVAKQPARGFCQTG